MSTHKHANGPQSHMTPSKVLIDYELPTSKEIPSTSEVLREGISWTLPLDIPEEQLAILKKFDHEDVDYAGLVYKYETQWVTATFSFLSTVNDVKLLRFIVALLYKILKTVPIAWNYIFKLYDHEGSKIPFSTLYLLILSEQDVYLCHKLIRIYAMLMLEFPTINATDSKLLLVYLNGMLKKGQTHYHKKSGSPSRLAEMIAINTLQDLLSNRVNRVTFWKIGGVSSISRYIRVPDGDAPNIQLLYEAIRCLWLMSFDSAIRETLTDPILISQLVDIIRHVSKDKIIRLSLHTLRNILNVGKNNELMISYGIMRCLDMFIPKKWGDEDIDESLDILKTTLEQKVDDLSSFDVYKNEVLGLKFDWSSPAHKSEHFWRSNIARFDEDNHFIIRRLKDVLSDPNTSDVGLAVACWDIGEIARFHPQREFLMRHLDIKTPVVTLIDHLSPEVKKEALLALQKLMITNWELLAQSPL